MVFVWIFLTIIAAAAIAVFTHKGRGNTENVVWNDLVFGEKFTELDIPRKQINEPKFSVLHISDLHLENNSISPERFYSLVKKKMNHKRLDLVVITGDFIDRKRSIPKLKAFMEAVKRLNPELGIYAVLGNHDYILREPHFSRFVDILESYGCKVLRNESHTVEKLGKRINLIGIDDYSTGRSRIEQAYEGIAEEGFNLVLTHDPNVVLDMRKTQYDYLLAGHFHGGQIHWPKPYHLYKMGKLVRMKMIKGMQELDGKPFYISEGLGQTGVNIRFGSSPELTLHQIPAASVPDANPTASDAANRIEEKNQSA